MHFGILGDTVDLVIGVVNAQDCVSAEAGMGHRLVVDRQPEVTEFSVTLVDACVVDPEGRIFGGFSVDTHHRKI